MRDRDHYLNTISTAITMRDTIANTIEQLDKREDPLAKAMRSAYNQHLHTLSDVIALANDVLDLLPDATATESDDVTVIANAEALLYAATANGSLEIWVSDKVDREGDLYRPVRRLIDSEYPVLAEYGHQRDEKYARGQMTHLVYVPADHHGGQEA